MGTEVLQVLITHPQAQMVSMAGSTLAGAATAKRSSEIIMPVLLELDGELFQIVCEYADFDRAVRRDRGGIRQQKQSLHGVLRLLVQRTIYDCSVEKLAAGVR